MVLPPPPPRHVWVVCLNGADIKTLNLFIKEILKLLEEKMSKNKSDFEKKGKRQHFSDQQLNKLQTLGIACR